MVCYSGLMNEKKSNSCDSHGTKNTCTFVKCKLWSVVASQFIMNVLKEFFFCVCFFFAISKVLQFLAFNSWCSKLLKVLDDLG